MESPPKYHYLVIILTGIIIALIPASLAQQPSFLTTAVTTLMIFIWYVIIFSLGIPQTRNHLRSIFSDTFALVLLGTNLIGPYLIVLGFGLPFLGSLLTYILWYVIPSLLLAFSIRSIDQISPLVRLVSTAVAAILYWIGFDHRYTMFLFDVFTDLSYILSGFWIASLMLIGYGYSVGIQYHSTPDDHDRGLLPTKRGLTRAQIASIGASVIIVPVGLLTGFLSWNPQWPGLIDVVIAFIGIYLTIALQEELVFRGILLNELDQFSLSRGVHPVLTLGLTSFLFGLTHWNNEIATYVPHYIILATIAGVAYGWAYRKSGLFGAMITHTLIDWVWRLFLERV